MFLVHDHLDLLAGGQEAVGLEGAAVASDFDVSGVGDFDEAGFDADLLAKRAGRQVIDADMRADAFFMRLQKVNQDLSGGELEVVGDGPTGIDPVDDHAVKGRAHVRRDGNLDRANDSRLESWFHTGRSLTEQRT